MKQEFMKRRGMTLLEPESALLQEEVYREALKVLKDYFETDGDDRPEKILKARIAMGSVGSYAKLQQTNRVKDATQLAVISLVSDKENKKQLRDYVKTSLPHLNPMNE